MINNPIRYADNCKSTLLDYIYTNITKQTTKSGECVFEILDHLPAFCIVENTRCRSDAKTKLIRNMRHFIRETFMVDLDNELSSLSQDFSGETNTASVNQDALSWSTCLILLFIDMPLCVLCQGKKID